MFKLSRCSPGPRSAAPLGKQGNVTPASVQTDRRRTLTIPALRPAPYPPSIAYVAPNVHVVMNLSLHEH